MRVWFAQKPAVLPHACGPPGGGLEPVTSRVLKGALRDPRINVARGGAPWAAQRLMREFQQRRYFSAAAATAKKNDGAGGEKSEKEEGEGGIKEGGFGAWPAPLRSLANAWTDAGAVTAESEGVCVNCASVPFVWVLGFRASGLDP